MKRRCTAWGVLLALGGAGCGAQTGEEVTSSATPSVSGTATPSPAGTETQAPQETPSLEPTPTLAADDGRPEGWTDESHGDGDPNYERVFPDDRVQRLDLTIAPEDWQAMLDQMTELVGEFGTGSMGGGGGAPTEDAACEGKNPGDTCELSTDGTTGECTAFPGGLVCAEPIPDEAYVACEGHTTGEECTYTTSEGASVSGVCQGPPGQDLACMSGGQGGGAGGGNGDFIEEDLLYVPAQVVFDDITWWNVGVRFKGNSSLAGSWSQGIYKLPFKFDFDEFEDEFPAIDDQRFFGFKHLSLSNGLNDSSLIRQKMMGEIFRSAGVKATRSAFYRVYIDVGEGPTYFGLYTVDEVIENTFLDSTFGEHEGNLYKPEDGCADWTCFAEENFAKENNEGAADWSDVQGAVAALNADPTDAAAWREELEVWLDVDAFLLWLATNTLAVNWDTYGAMPHNYYLYGDPAHGGRLVWMPWDHNEALQISGRGGDTEIDLSDVTDEWPLIRFVMDAPVYALRYQELMAGLLEGAFATGPLQARMEEAHAMVEPYVVGEEGEQAPYSCLQSQQDFVEALPVLLEHVSDRYDVGQAFTQP